MSKLSKYFGMSHYKRSLAMDKHVFSKWTGKKYQKFGTDSVIHKPLLVEDKKCISIGSHVLIRDGARIETINAWHKEKYAPQLVIEDNVSIEQRVHLECAASLRICHDVTISSDVFISDCSHSYQNVDTNALENALEVREVYIGPYSFIGSGAKIMPGARLGTNVIVGANAVVTHAVEDYAVVAGVPARVIKRYNKQKKEWETV
jgi:acetyltransferase-like isoleucine patch superfamily enzyme